MNGQGEIAPSSAAPSLGRRRFLASSVAVAGGIAVWPSRAWTQSATTSGAFSFLHVSDSHLSPRFHRMDHNENARSLPQLRWIEEQVRGLLDGPSVTGEPVPRFAIVTGDLAEYSVIDATWNDIVNAYGSLPIESFFVAGNHDNTWATINPRLRHRHGGDSYSFDRFGWHFVCLNTSGTLDPLPAFDRRTLDWLSEDLESVARGTPIVLAMHHPLSGNSGYAGEYDRLRLLERLEGHHVALMLDGHWHVGRAGRWAGIDRVCGGTTFGKNTGFGRVIVSEGRVTYRYRYYDAERGEEQLLDKPAEFAPVALLSTTTAVRPNAVTISTERTGVAGHLDAYVHDVENHSVFDSDRKLTIDTSGLEPGEHYVSLSRGAEDAQMRGVARFTVEQPGDRLRARRWQAAGSCKALREAPGGRFVAADTSGQVVLVDAATLDVVWRNTALVECVHALAIADDLVFAGDTDGNLLALELGSGEIVARRDFHRPLLAPPVIDGDRVYLCDAGGWLTSSRFAELPGDGDRNLVAGTFSKQIADFGFEAAPALRDGLLVAGSWDGSVYGIDTASAEVRWKAWSPMGQVGTKSRYYGPADSSPVILGERVFVTDRGYRFGSFTLDGAFERLIRTQVAAIALSPDGQTILAKTLDDKLIRFDAEGEVVFEVEALGGRVPSAPAERDGLIATTSDRGLLTIANADDGGLVARSRLSPNLFLLASPIWVSDRTVVTADTDGQVHVVEVNV